jgi:hypothetical protein
MEHGAVAFKLLRARTLAPQPALESSFLRLGHHDRHVSRTICLGSIASPCRPAT